MKWIKQIGALTQTLNFRIYDAYYLQMMLAGLAIELPEPLCMNKAEELILPDDLLVYGLPVRYKLIHLDWLLFMGEMGIKHIPVLCAI